MNNVRLHLSRLADFTGRETREPFWWWILTLYIAQTALGMLAAAPMQLWMSRAMQPIQDDPEYLQRHPEYLASIMQQVGGPFVRYLVIVFAALMLVQLGLLAAAVTRRLHDRNHSGWWAAPLAGIQVATALGYAWLMPKVFGLVSAFHPRVGPVALEASFSALIPAFAAIVVLGLAGLVLLIVLVVQLVQRGTVGPNRYGPDPLPPPVRLATLPRAEGASPRAARVVRSDGDPLA